MKESVVIVVGHHCHASLIWHTFYRADPTAVEDGINDPGVKPLDNPLFNYFNDRAQSALRLD